MTGRLHVTRNLAFTVAVALIVAWAILSAYSHRDQVSGADLGLLASFSLWVAIGGLLDVRLPFSGLVVCPVAAAAAGSLAMVSRWPRLTFSGEPQWNFVSFGTAYVVLAVALGAAVSAFLSWRWFHVEVSSRQRLALVPGALASALLFRWLHQPDGTLLHMMLTALLVSAAPGVVWFFTSGTSVVGRLPERGREVALGLLPVYAATIGTTTAIAFGMHALGALAPPLLASPLLLMRFAMQQQDRQRSIRHQTVIALSRLTEVAGYNRVGHSRQVAQLCRGVGVRLGVTDRALATLEEAALLHDIGQVSLDRPIPDGATTEAAPVDQQAIAASGAAIVRRTGRMSLVAGVLDQQATPYHVRFTESADIPLSSRILKVCNAYVDHLAGDPTRHALALERLYLGLGYEYDPDVIDALLAELGGEVPTR